MYTHREGERKKDRDKARSEVDDEETDEDRLILHTLLNRAQVITKSTYTRNHWGGRGINYIGTGSGVFKYDYRHTQSIVSKRCCVQTAASVRRGGETGSALLLHIPRVWGLIWRRRKKINRKLNIRQGLEVWG